MRAATKRRLGAALAIGFTLTTILGVFAFMPQPVRAEIEVEWYCQKDGSAMIGSTWWAMADPQAGPSQSEVLNRGQARLEVPLNGQIVVGFDYDLLGNQRTTLSVEVEMKNGRITRYSDPEGLSPASTNMTQLLVHVEAACPIPLT